MVTTPDCSWGDGSSWADAGDINDGLWDRAVPDTGVSLWMDVQSTAGACPKVTIWVTMGVPHPCSTTRGTTRGSPKSTEGNQGSIVHSCSQGVGSWGLDRGAQLGLQDLLLPHSGMELSSLHPLGLAPLVSPKTLVPRHPPLHCELCKNCRYWGCG